MASDEAFRYQRQNWRDLWSILPLVLLLTVPTIVTAQPDLSTTPLTTTYYDKSCPNLQDTVKAALYKEMKKEWRIGASLERLQFHDCFVQGCDASVFLDDTPTSLGEKQAKPNNNSLRGFDQFDNIKAAVEAVCPGVVSCADILIIVARDAVVFNGGPWWNVELGRRDSLGANFELANTSIPLATQNASAQISLFGAQGLTPVDLVALVGSHTFGKAQCKTFKQRLYNSGGPDRTLDPAYAKFLEIFCPDAGSNTTVVNLDQATPTTFDNAYYSNLLINKGLLESDQTLYTDNKGTAATVNTFAVNQNQFFNQFIVSMTRLGRITPLTGTAGEIRCNCRKVNS